LAIRFALSTFPRTIAMPTALHELADDRLRQIFAALLAAQGLGTSEARARAQIAREFALSYQAVLKIEQIGRDREWPPLGKFW
jgi:hypothetical protein